MKYINIDTDDKIKAKINNVRITVAKLGNIVPKKDRDDIRKELYKIEKKLKEKNTQKFKRKRFIITLLKQQISLIKQNDLDHFGTRDIENSFTNTDDADYYKPILV